MDDRRKMLKFRAWRRGFREIDLILGGFADRHLADMDEAHVDAFERLLGEADSDLYEWITETRAPPPELDTPTLALIRCFRFSVSDALKT
ncbi:MAG TPA: succinate dehydrogenase assembly factor 2 [Caulobacterales bacterium]|nr:succinate dehydrogenase assembly factor 2 [Caulobacterales bacterium]